ncbi:pilin [Photobacterium sanguinicancri]|uniref:Prepilin-type cleavage/methylation domain-containing protein n=1 Tax=Photobacterium sanguinicancri TaxID=875932 RepID=A0ABX4FT58_9GAMM|nr:prepilin-type N-terminal cleavage/methylation domain-containing protein [Photobacterium sanguinicancri]OZS41993.1 prepilin-type cleavage/methylation domain-containing protein [Photobacterium sanguinicancri]
MKKMQKGFTLIELMIVVAIIGVLSAIAVPAYESYVKKSEAATGVSTVRSLLTNIDMKEQEKGAFPATLAEIGADANMSSLGTVAIAPTKAGELYGTATFTYNTKATLKTKKITYTKTKSGWKCTHDTGLTLKSCG